jgi:hypothetical protein
MLALNFNVPAAGSSGWFVLSIQVSALLILLCKIQQIARRSSPGVYPRGFFMPFAFL